MENNTIATAIHFLVAAQWRERKALMRELVLKGSIEYNGFTFQRETWCWLIWKPTDIGEHPEWKGEPLLKIVPMTIEEDVAAMEKVLANQPWTYL